MIKVVGPNMAQKIVDWAIKRSAAAAPAMTTAMPPSPWLLCQ